MMSSRVISVGLRDITTGSGKTKAMRYIMQVMAEGPYATLYCHLG